MKIPLAPSDLVRPLLVLALWTGGASAATADSAATAALAVSIEANGRGHVHVFLTAVLTNPPALTAAVSRTVGVGLEDVDLDIEEFKKVATLAAETTTPFPHTLTRIWGRLDLQPMADFLRSYGARTFSVRLTHPRTPQTRCPLARQTSVTPVVQYNYSVPLANASVPRLEFQFGYSSAEVERIVGPLLAILLAPLALTARRRQPPANGPPSFEPNETSPAQRWRFRRGLFTWLLWIAAVYWLRGDELAWFVLGCDSLWGQIAAVVGIFVAPPLLVLALADLVNIGCCQSAGAKDSTAHGDRALTRWQVGGWAVGSQVRFLVPAAFAAVGIAFLREGITGKAAEWSAVALGAAITAVCLVRWVNAGRRSETPDQPALLLRRRLERQAACRRALVLLTLVVVLPALVVGLGERYRLADNARMVAYAAGLIGTIVLLRLTRWFLTRRSEPRLPAAPAAETRPAAAPGRAWNRFRFLLQPFVVAAVALVGCELFDFPFVLTRGDEGWALVLMSFCIAWVETLPDLLRPAAGQPGC